MAAGRGATAQPCEHRVDDRLPQHRAGIAGASRLAPSRRARHQPPAQHACVTRLRTIPPRNVRRETDTRAVSVSRLSFFFLRLYLPPSHRQRRPQSSMASLLHLKTVIAPRWPFHRFSSSHLSPYQCPPTA